MNKFTTALTLALLTSAVHADPLFPMASVPDVTDGDGWVIALGAGLEYEAEYDGSDDYGAEPEPGFIAQYRRGNTTLFFEGQELGWRRRVADRWLVQAGLRFEGGREASESPALDGLGDTDDELVAMAEVRRAFGESWSRWVAGRLMTGDGDIGVLGVAAVGATLGQRERARRYAASVDVLAFVTFGSSAFVNRDFGITAQQSVDSGLPVADIAGGFRSAGIQVAARWRFGPRWQLEGEAGYERYSSDIANSAITRDDFEAEIGASLLYRF